MWQTPPGNHWDGAKEQESSLLKKAKSHQQSLTHQHLLQARARCMHFTPQLLKYSYFL